MKFKTTASDVLWALVGLAILLIGIFWTWWAK